MSIWSLDSLGINTINGSSSGGDTISSSNGSTCISFWCSLVVYLFGVVVFLQLLLFLLLVVEI